MRLDRLWLHDFRCYEDVAVELGPGCTVVRGANGQGKTSLLEAVSWVATARSFRGVPDAALVRAGAEEGIVRAQLHPGGDREVLVEAAIRAAGRNRVLVNKQPSTRRRDLVEHLRVTVFAPDDLELVKGSPSQRRQYLDDLLEATAPRFAGVRTELERVLRQRNALLRARIRTAEDRTTLEVLDDRLLAVSAELVRGRLRLGARVLPRVEQAYADLAGDAPGFTARYAAGWSDDPITEDAVEDQLRAAFAALRTREQERGVTLVGPHRDDWQLVLHDLDARHHASQGEQRTLALALRLGGHHLVGEVIGAAPVLLLDDVFSELDAARAAALVRNLPPAQTLLTTAGLLPEGITADAWWRVEAGGVTVE
jgi:DNA replication and repair protein RecF